MNALALPLAIPLITAALCLIGWTRPDLQRWLSLTGSVAQLLASIALYRLVDARGMQVLQVGGWPAPFGITFVADTLSAILLVLAGIMGVVVVVHSFESIDPQRVALGYFPLVHVLLLGVSGAFLTGDLFNLFVWFEVLLISSFVLMALGGEKPQLQGAFKYVAINLVSSAVFLSALGLLYGTTGTLNMAHLALVVSRSEDTGFLVAVGMMFVGAFGIKAGLFPFYFWLPASYHTPPFAVSALFGGLLTKVGVYALLRVFGLVFVQESTLFEAILVALAAITMMFGGLGAVVQTDIRRLISFHMLTGIGAMVLGIGIANASGYEATVLYMIHSTLATMAMFLIAGQMAARTGTSDIRQMGGLYKMAPGLSLGFFLVALALSGVPPLSGFFPKLGLIEAGIQDGAYWGIVALLASSILGIAAYARAWSLAFWRPGEPPAPIRRGLAYDATAASIVAVLVLTLVARPVTDAARQAGASVADRRGYIANVLPEAP